MSAIVHISRNSLKSTHYRILYILCIIGFALGLQATLAPSARAQTATGLEVQLFRPAPGRNNFLSLESTRLDEPGSLSFGFFYGYQRDPLVLRGGGRIVERIVSDQQTANLLFSVTVASFLEFGVDLPLHTRMDGGGGRYFIPGASLDTAAVVGDVRLAMRWRLLGAGKEGGGLALSTPLTFPLGHSERFRGDSGITFSPRVVFDYGWSRAAVAAYVGYLFREEARLGSLRFDDELLYGVGASATLWSEEIKGAVRGRLTAMAELVGRTSAITPFNRGPENPMELLLGLRFGFPSRDLSLTVGGGVGLQAGYGIPAGRVFAGLQWAPSTPPPPPPPQAPAACPTCAAPPPLPCPACKRCPEGPACPSIANCPAPRPCETCRTCAEPTACPEPTPCPDAKAPSPPKEPVVVRLQHVYFELDKRTPRADSAASLDRLAELLKKYPTLRLRIEGHTDNLGKSAYNKKLSQTRADGVRAALLLRGIAAHRVTALGHGPDHPVADNKHRAGRRQNRRVELHFTEGVPDDLRIQIQRMTF